MTTSSMTTSSMTTSSMTADKTTTSRYETAANHFEDTLRELFHRLGDLLEQTAQGNGTLPQLEQTIASVPIVFSLMKVWGMLTYPEKEQSGNTTPPANRS